MSQEKLPFVKLEAKLHRRRISLFDIISNLNAYGHALLNLSHPSPDSGLSHQNLVVKNNSGERLGQTFGKRQRKPIFDEMTL